MDVEQLPDGSLLISDDQNGWLYRITHRATENHTGTVPPATAGRRAVLQGAVQPAAGAAPSPSSSINAASEQNWRRGGGMLCTRLQVWIVIFLSVMTVGML